MFRPFAMLACAAMLASPLRAGPAAVETLVEAPGPQGSPAGTMLSPEGARGPVVLIIPGSGPTDRDGNNPMGVRASTYWLLAEGLAAQGITSVRIDKRGMFGSAAAVPDANAVTIPDYVSDTDAWVKVIRAQTGADCVWLMGHSEGGLVALAAAQKIEGLCGVVLLAAPGKPLGELLKAQLRANPANAPLIGAADAAIDRLAAGQRVDPATLPVLLLPLFNPAVQDFLISAMALDPAALAAQTRLPILILQGAKDLQVPINDAERLKAANPAALLVILADANHVFKEVAGNNLADNLASYRAPDLPLSSDVVPAIAGFIRD